MSRGEDDDDKQYDASQRKLDDARKKGEIARSGDLNTAAAFGGLLLVATLFGPATIRRFGDHLVTLIDHADRLSSDVFSDAGATIGGSIMLGTLKTVAPWIGGPALAVLLSIVAQQSFVVAPDKLTPRLSRISMVSNVKNKFGRNGFFEFAKSFVKLSIISAILAVFILNRADQMIASAVLSPSMVAGLMGHLFVSFLSLVVVIAFVFGGVDYVWQLNEHARNQKMTRQEMVDESKDNEGDPHIKQKRRQRAYEIANNQMMSAVPTADVIIVNPTHYAVALKWNRTSGGAPSCVAKGVDEIATQIRKIAAESGVPIHSDPPTARALFAQVEIGAEIQLDHYRAVAAAIRFAEVMRTKARGRRL